MSLAVLIIIILPGGAHGAAALTQIDMPSVAVCQREVDALAKANQGNWPIRAMLCIDRSSRGLF